MASYPFYNPAPVFMDQFGLKPSAGGFLYFYDKGTTTPRNTWSDSGLTILNTNPVPLDSSGRANVNIWCDGEYTVVQKDAANVVIATRDFNNGATGGFVIPQPLVAGTFLGTDGSIGIWDSIRQMPDPTGSDGKVPVATGGTYVLQSFPTIPTQPVVTDNSLQIGNIKQQWGAGSVPATGGAAISNVTINFPTAYLSPPSCQVSINRGSGVVPAGFIGCLGWSASTTQLTVYFDLNITQTGSQYNLVSPVPISWLAVGKVAT